MYIASAPQAEIQNPDSDLHQGQARIRQDDPPIGAPDTRAVAACSQIR